MSNYQNKLNKINRIAQVVKHQKLINLLFSNKFGVPKSKVEAIEMLDDKTKMKDITVKRGDEYYVFDGPSPERDFCVYMMKIDKVFSIEDINAMSILMGYDVFEYQPGPIMKDGGPGGPNCKHKWRRFRGKFITDGNVPSDRQIGSLVNKSIFN